MRGHWSPEKRSGSGCILKLYRWIRYKCETKSGVKAAQSLAGG